MMLWAYFYCYQLTLDIHEHGAGSIVSPSPTVVYDEKQNAIVQANLPAISEGIEVGYGLAQAAALCPHIHILEYDREVEKQAIAQLAHQLYPLASDIVLDTHNAIAIRLDNLLQYYGGHSPLQHVLIGEMTNTGFHFHFATAWGVEAARLLARNKTNQYVENKECIAKHLSRCAIEKTSLDTKTISTLAKVGIKRVGQLLRLPVHELGQRFSNDTIRYLTALRGETFPKYTLFRPSENFEHTQTLPFEVENTQHLIPYIASLLKALEQYLRARNLLSSSILFTIHFREAAPLPIEVNAALAFATQKDWHDLVALKIETLLLPEPAVAITLSCQHFEAIEDGDGDFFSHRFSTVAQKQLIGRLKAKLGDDSTVQPSVGNSHAFESMSIENSHHQAPAYGSDVAPTFLFSKPKPLNVSTRIYFGPVRIETEWWSRHPHKKDYFIAETSLGVRLLVFKDTNAKWWVQGIYS